MPLLLFLTIFNSMRSTVEDFWKNGSFSEHALWEISDDFVDTKPRGIKPTCIIVVIGGGLA